MDTKKSLIKQIAEQKCGHCQKPRGEHSKKNLLRCLYTGDVNLYNAYLKIQELTAEIEKLKPKKETKKDE